MKSKDSASTKCTSSGRGSSDSKMRNYKDYFFEVRYKKAYFEQLTNLVPMSRSASLRGALRQAGDLLRIGLQLGGLL